MLLTNIVAKLITLEWKEVSFQNILEKSLHRPLESSKISSYPYTVYAVTGNTLDHLAIDSTTAVVG